MTKRIFLLCLTLIFTVFVAVACSNQSNDSDAQNNEEESDQSNEVENEASNQDNEANDSNSDDTQNDEESDSRLNGDNEQSISSDDNASADNNDLPETIEIDEQIQHEEGVTFTLEQISFEEDHITVDFNAENHSGFSQYLASAGRAKSSNLGGITLQDDTGYDYRYVADDDSDRIELEDQEKVTGTVSFAGRIQDDAHSLTLTFNPNNVEPEFSFEDIQIEWQ